MLKGTLIFPFSFFTVFCILASTTFLSVEASSHGKSASALGHLVQKHERKLLIETEYGEISAVKISDGTKGPYHLQFITLEPNSLFLPVLLHADMVFFVHTGSGTLSWTDDNEIRKVNIRKGDIYRLHPGSVFYVQSSLETEREKLRIYAIFSNTEDSIYEPSVGAYSSITDVVLGFDSKVLQAAFKVPEDVIEEMMKATKPPAIIHAVQKKKIFCEWQARFLKAFLGSNSDGFGSINGKKKKTKPYNVLKADPDFKNCNGWSLTVDRNDWRLFRDSNIGVFMVNLTKGSMMGPHWNPRASEIAIVLQGQGMIRVTWSSNANESECKNLRFRVKEGDVFSVPRFHPMAQMSFNNDSFVFMGFSTSTKRNYPQFLTGKSSVLGILDRQILAVSFNVSNTTIDQLLTPQKESVILDCTSCAEEEECIMEEEIEREREEERREEEEARKRQEEEARKRKEEEEEAKKKEEEEARKRKEEEEAKKREEEEAQKRKEEEEKAKKREEEEDRKRKEKEEEAKKREEEEKKRREEEARKEQEEARRQEEERQRRARQEEEEERKRQEEKEKQEEKKKKEKERRRKEEKEREEPRKRKEEKGRQEEAAAREQKEAKRQEKDRQRRAEQEEMEARREREKQRGQPEKRETEEGSDEGRRRVPKKVWEI